MRIFSTNTVSLLATAWALSPFAAAAATAADADPTYHLHPGQVFWYESQLTWDFGDPGSTPLPTGNWQIDMHRQEWAIYRVEVTGSGDHPQLHVIGNDYWVCGDEHISGEDKPSHLDGDIVAIGPDGNEHRYHFQGPMGFHFQDAFYASSAAVDPTTGNVQLSPDPAGNHGDSYNAYLSVFGLPDLLFSVPKMSAGAEAEVSLRSPLRGRFTVQSKVTGAGLTQISYAVNDIDFPECEVFRMPITMFGQDIDLRLYANATGHGTMTTDWDDILGLPSCSEGDWNFEVNLTTRTSDAGESTALVHRPLHAHRIARLLHDRQFSIADVLTKSEEQAALARERFDHWWAVLTSESPAQANPPELRNLERGLARAILSDFSRKP